ncbi:Esterase OVCA2 [Armadillidium vulgare]|nr:Esterase OVCA2 [Armadillidium vulgare]
MIIKIFNMATERKLRILCFHGYRQTGEIFRQKTGSLRKALKKHAELYYLTAPLQVPPSENSKDEDNGCGWWFSREDDYFSAKHKSDFVKGFEDSLKCVEDYVTSNGPFDGFLGFSQGACLVALLCHLQESQSLSYSFKFAITVAGFVSQCSPHQCLYKDDVSIPTLHIIGETDQVIGSEMSEELLNYFKTAVVHRHSGGHYVPATSSEKEAYIKFLDKK